MHLGVGIVLVVVGVALLVRRDRASGEAPALVAGAAVLLTGVVLVLLGIT